MYEQMTEIVIRTQMLSKITSLVTKIEGTLIYDSVSPTANQIAQVYIELNEILKRAFAQTSYDDWLDKIAEATGITRKGATKAYGKITLTGLNGTVISSGTIFQTIDRLQFATTQSVQIVNGTASVNVQAVGAGTNFNAEANTVTQIPVAVVGLTSVNNKAAITGGSNIETDDELRERILYKAQNLMTSGNIAHYKFWTTNVDGTGDCRVVPNKYGEGTVGVVVIDSNKVPANDLIVNNVITNIEANRPIGATVTVIPAISVPINITVTVSKNSSYGSIDVINNIKLSVKKVLQDNAFVNDYVSNAKISNAILTSVGVTDASGLAINNLVGQNITLNSDEVGVLGDVIVNVA